MAGRLHFLAFHPAQKNAGILLAGMAVSCAGVWGLGHTAHPRDLPGRVVSKELVARHNWKVPKDVTELQYFQLEDDFSFKKVDAEQTPYFIPKKVQPDPFLRGLVTQPAGIG
jgi:hypothetical protein